MRVLLVSEAKHHPNFPMIGHLERMGVSFRHVHLKDLRGQKSSRGLSGKLNRYWPGRQVVGPIVGAIREFQPDIIHVTAGRPTAIPVINALGNSTIPVVVEYGAIDGMNMLNPFDWKVYFNRRISRLVVPTRAVVNNWMGQPLFWRCIGPDRCCVVPHPVALPPALAPEDRSRLRAQYGLADDDMVIGTVCTVRPIKNVEFVAEVVRRLGPPFVFAVVGPATESRQAELRRIGGDRVKLLGPIPGARNMVGIFDIFVTPTKLPGEAFGLAPAEAMAASVPVVTMNFGGSAEIVEHGVSGYALPSNASDWQDTLRRLGEGSELRKSMGRAAYERIASRFAPDIGARACHALYQNLLAGKR